MNIQLGGHLPFYVPTRQGKLEVPLKEPARLGELLARLGIPVSEVYLTVVNGQLVTLDETTVSDSDDVRLYPPMDGG
jgi:sulfur carrier protein ThiS